MYKVYEDTNFVTGDSPVTHDFQAAKGYMAEAGWIFNYGTGDLQMKVEGNRLGKRHAGQNETVLLASAETIRVPARGYYDLKNLNMNIAKVQIIWVEDTAYSLTLA